MHTTQIMIDKMPATETENIKKMIFSRKVRRVFGLDLHSWEQLMLLSLLAVFITTASVVILQRAENAKTKNEFEEYKLEAGANVAEANARAAEANQKAQEASLELAKLTEAMSPRFVDPRISIANIEKHAAVLGKITIVSCPDFEPFRLAGQINAMLRHAHWDSTIVPYDDEVLFDGVVVKSLPPPAYGPQAVTANVAWMPVWDAVNGLVEQLSLSKIDATRGTASPAEEKLYSAANELRILIGRKPLNSNSQEITE